MRPLWLAGGAGLLAIGTYVVAESVVGVGYDQWTVHCFSGVNDRGSPYCMIDYRLPHTESGWNIASSEGDFVITTFGQNPKTCGRIEIRERGVRPSWHEVHPPTDMPQSEKVADAALAAMQSHLPLIGECQRGRAVAQPTMKAALSDSTPGLRRAIANVEDGWRSKMTAER